MPPLSIVSSSNYTEDYYSNDTLNSSNILQSSILYLKYELNYQFFTSLNDDFTKDEEILAKNISKLLVEATSLFKKKNEDKLKTMLSKCTLDGPHLSYNTFCSVLSYLTEMAISGPVSRTTFTYGRLVGIFTFIGIYSKFLLDNDCLEDINTLILYASKLMAKWINISWKRDKLSWEDFNNKTKLSIKTIKIEYENNKIITTVTVVVGACAIAVAALGIYYGIRKTFY
ncbi:Bcl2-like family and Blc2 family-containing protein [Strongyloides ratti]|uniref:Bcl2-like family and Blc2 family-containing protein n=1 Tax=Strongyloides ratti TaxID=34506 RepID=A0A090MY91_STRRB|nr:Bcl2-like family and Blc2 family-containing protein [Strongyloides ratti]CEF66774.1 Bcl2-like family and Blc2 family-containing protein [Strongyloides ratti]